MADYQEVLVEILKQVRPDKQEEASLKELANMVLEVAKKEMERYGGKAILAGSLTRDTWLPDRKEFDIFLMFPKNFIEKELEDIGLAIGKSVMKRFKGTYVLEYAQHPYVSGKIGDTEVDVVPCYEIGSTKELKSAVDRTPFHVKYVEENLPVSLSDEVRMLKLFCRSNGIYGADARTEGFSGYACEILIINYGKFINLLKAASDWRPGHIIDTEEIYGKSDYKHLRDKFRNQSLILIDPTDKNRNVASAVSHENFFKFVKLASRFLTNPSKSFFARKLAKPLEPAELKEYLEKRGTSLVILKFDAPDVVPDILWPQLRRFAERLQSILEETRYEFKVLRKGVHSDNKDTAIILFEMEFDNLPKIQKRVGPSVFDPNDSKRFVEKYREDAINGPFVEGGKWMVEIERPFLTVRDKLADSLKKDAPVLEAKGIPNYIAKQLAKTGFRIFSDADAISNIMQQDEGFAVFLRQHFEKESLA